MIDRVVRTGFLACAILAIAARPALAEGPRQTAFRELHGISRTTRALLDDPGMVEVPAGWFEAGPADGDLDERPSRRVYVDAFLIDRYEVTNRRYRRFLDATGHRVPAYWNDARFNEDDQPVVGVAWDDAVAFCRWAGARLPTELEWEKTARGTDGRRYPWGDGDPDAGGHRANLYHDGGAAGDGFVFPAPIGSFPAGASPYGALDMAGNASEWCSDLHPAVRGSADHGYRSVRGGSWLSNSAFLRCAVRDRRNPSHCHNYVGFRCAKSVSREDAR